MVPCLTGDGAPPTFFLLFRCGSIENNWIQELWKSIKPFRSRVTSPVVDEVRHRKWDSPERPANQWSRGKALNHFSEPQVKKFRATASAPATMSQRAQCNRTFVGVAGGWRGIKKPETNRFTLYARRRRGKTRATARIYSICASLRNGIAMRSCF